MGNTNKFWCGLFVVISSGEELCDVFTVPVFSLMFGVTGLLCRGGEHEYRLTKYLLSNYELVRLTGGQSQTETEKQI